MNNKKIAIVYLIISAFLYVLFGVGIRLIDTAMTPALGIILRLTLSACLYILLFYRYINIKRLLQLDKSDYLYLLLMGTLGYSVYILFISHGTLATTLFGVAVALGITPIWTYILSIIFLKYKFSIKVSGLLLLAIVGVAIMSSGSIASVQNLNFFNDKGFLLVSVAALLGAIYAILRNRLSDNLNNHEVSFMILLIAAIGSIFLLFTEETKIIYDNLLTFKLIFGIVLGASLNIATAYLLNYSFKNINVVLGEQLLLLENVFAIIIGFLFYNESITFTQIIGAMLIIISGYYISKYLD